MKNFNLLLATTALLSTGALAVMAATDSVSTTLKANINLYSPFTINGKGGLIQFPAITVSPQDDSGVIKITVRPDGTVDESQSNAQIFNAWGSNGIATGAKTEAITISGGDIGGLAESYENATTDEEIAAIDDEFNNAVGDSDFNDNYNVSLSANEIAMEVDGDGAPCGTVKNLTRRWHYDKANNALELRFGGTFELYKDTENNKFFAPGANGYTGCSGEITVTFMHH